MKKDVGGSAFPVRSEPTWSITPELGMSLRDYFAAKAIQGLMGRDWSHIKDDAEKVAAWARAAYKVADAMLAERAK